MWFVVEGMLVILACNRNTAPDSGSRNNAMIPCFRRNVGINVSFARGLSSALGASAETWLRTHQLFSAMAACVKNSKSIM